MLKFYGIFSVNCSSLALFKGRRGVFPPSTIKPCLTALFCIIVIKFKITCLNKSDFNSTYHIGFALAPTIAVSLLSVKNLLRELVLYENICNFGTQPFIQGEFTQTFELVIMFLIYFVSFY